MKKYDVVVLGSGISALTSALLLAKSGRKVAVLEQYIKPGGYMHSFERFGARFDSGAHYIGSLNAGQPFRVLLEHLGIYDDGVFAPLDSEAFDVLHLPSGTVNLPQSYAETRRTLSERFPRERPAIARYLELVKAVSSTFPTYRFNEQTADFPPEALEVSLQAVVEGLTADPALQCVFYAYCNLHGVRPADVAFGFHAVVTDSLLEGARGLNGGGDALTKLFTRALEAHGADILTRHRVERLEVDDRRQVHSIHTQNGGEFTAEWVISSLHPKTTFALVSRPDLFPPVFKERLHHLQESSGIFGMYAVCRERPLSVPARNHYFFASENPAAMFRAANPTDRPSLVFMSSPKRAWPEDEKNFPLSLHSPAAFEWFQPWRDQRYGRRSVDYGEFKNQLSAQVLAAVEAYWPEFPAKIERFATSTPLTHLHFNGSPDGSSFGLYHSMQNTGARSFGPRTKVLNLLLTGQNCVFPGLLGAAIAGLRTSGHILGIKAVLRELRLRGESSL